MIDKETDAVEPAELGDDQLDDAVGGFMVQPVATSPLTTHKSGGDPCMGGE